MKSYITIVMLASAVLSAAQQTSIDEVLRRVDEGNKELQASRRLIASQKIEAATENNLPDPTVTYSHLYGNKEGMGFTGELIASQSFSFPTLYFERGKLARQRGESLETGGETLRREVLLRAKEVCLDLVMLNRERSLLEVRRHNAEELQRLYSRRLEAGDAGRIETNKIALELLNVRSEVRMNEAARTDKIQELKMLCGGAEVEFTDTVYPEVSIPASLTELEQEVLSSDSRLCALRSEQSVAKKRIAVSRAEGLPSFELGYRMNPSSGGERYNGFIVGISIPLFSNRGKVRGAKAQSLYADLQTESMQTIVESELMQLYSRAAMLKTSVDEYTKVLAEQTDMSLLGKAIQSGQISMIEYFAGVTTIYQSMQNCMQLENEYQKTLARLYKHRL